jgi:mevalonate kinase
MLFGEHAVLHGKRALVCAASARLTVSLLPRADRRVTIESALGRHETTLDSPAPAEPFRFVLAALAREAALLPGGFDLRIDSEFPATIGLGSSAAVTVATLAALAAHGGRSPSREALVRVARDVIRGVQGAGSGADAAASAFGGIVAYRADPLAIRRIAQAPPVTLAYSGSKMPTPEVIRRVETARAAMPAVFNAIYEAMNRVAEEATTAVEQANWTRVGALMNVAQGLMDAIGVNDATLSGLVYALRGDPAVLGAKISGSGLGDCVVALGRPARIDPSMREIPVSVGLEGLTVETAA